MTVGKAIVDFLANIFGRSPNRRFTELQAAHRSQRLLAGMSEATENTSLTDDLPSTDREPASIETEFRIPRFLTALAT